jgi:hypothetical protein
MRWVWGVVLALYFGAMLFFGWWVLQRPTPTAFALPSDFPRPEQCLAPEHPERVQRYFDNVLEAQKYYAREQSEAWWIPLGFDPNHGLEQDQREWRRDFNRYQELWVNEGCGKFPYGEFQDLLGWWNSHLPDSVRWSSDFVFTAWIAGSVALIIAYLMVIVLRGNYFEALHGRAGVNNMGYQAIFWSYLALSNLIVFGVAAPSGARVLVGILIGLLAGLGTVLFRGAGWHRDGEPALPERIRRRSELWWGIFGFAWGFYLAWRGLAMGSGGGSMGFLFLMIGIYALVVWLGMRYEFSPEPADG